MSDLVYDGGGGGGGYYPPSFDPNNPMGGGGGVPSGNYSPSGDSVYYSSTVRYADPSLTPEWFNQNFQSSNPYTQFYSHRVLDENLYKLNYIFQSGNTYQMIDDGSRTIVKVTNNAYVDFENKASLAQNTYYQSKTAEQNTLIEKAKTEFVNSYSSIKDSALNSDIQKLSDLKAQVSSLEFQDDITEYLNRIGDTNNSELLNKLKQQISAIENDISKRLIDYWRQQEIIRQKTSIDPTVGFSYLTDPYFGRGGDEIYFSKLSVSPTQQAPRHFFNLLSSGDISDWMAGGAMYDSPRAGDLLFNPMGNLNTTVFLGLENQNFTPSLTHAFANPEPFRMFGTLAGDTGFGVLSFSS